MFNKELGVICGKKLDSNGKPKGNLRNMPACGYLRLVLLWYCTKGNRERSKSVMFGQTSTSLYKWLKFGHHVLLHVLNRTPEAHVKLLNREEVSAFK